MRLSIGSFKLLIMASKMSLNKNYEVEVQIEKEAQS